MPLPTPIPTPTLTASGEQEPDPFCLLPSFGRGAASVGGKRRVDAARTVAIEKYIVEVLLWREDERV